MRPARRHPFVPLLLLAGLLLLPRPAAAQSDPEIVRVWTDDRVPLIGSLYEGTTRDDRGLVLLHMLGSDRTAWEPLAEAAQSRGMTVLAIDMRGHGDSVYTEEGERLNVYEFTDEDWATVIRDVSAAVDFLVEDREIEPERIILGGASIGANLALNYAAGDPDIHAVFLLSPGREYRGITTLDAVERYGERPLYLLASKEEGYGAQSVRLLETLSPSEDLEAVLVEGNRHGTANLNTISDLPKRILDWLDRID